MVSIKQKIVTLNKSVTYSAYVTTKQIEDEASKSNAVVKRLESQGYRCNEYSFRYFQRNKKIHCEGTLKRIPMRIECFKISIPDGSPHLN